MEFKTKKELEDFIRGRVRQRLQKTDTDEYQGDPSSPMNLMLARFPELRQTLEKLLSMQYRLFVNDIEWVAPKPTTFKVTLPNKQYFNLIWNTVQPELISTEYHLFSDEYEFAGTADIICRIDGKLHLLDIKTSNSIHSSYNLQLAAYAQAWNETHNEKVVDTGIVWLKSSTRGPSKDKIQGNGWQLKQIGEIEKHFSMFTKIYDIYRMENPDSKPATETLPTTIKISTEKPVLLVEETKKSTKKKK